MGPVGRQVDVRGGIELYVLLEVRGVDHPGMAEEPPDRQVQADHLVEIDHLQGGRFHPGNPGLGIPIEQRVVGIGHPVDGASQLGTGDGEISLVIGGRHDGREMHDAARQPGLQTGDGDQAGVVLLLGDDHLHDRPGGRHQQRNRAQGDDVAKSQALYGV